MTGGTKIMKKTIYFILFFVAILTLAVVVPNISSAATFVTDESTLRSTIESADYGATITLQNDITVTQPIVIAKELTIDGNGHTITGSSDWTSTSGNQTMFTAQFSDAKLKLKNIKLVNGPKYGVQSYDGATVILDDVSITGFRYGGVLANGGNVEVKNLHLGYNGTGANNGIEIDKGAAATNNPTLTMNGVLTSESTENVVRAAENGHLTEFTVTNTENTTNKVLIAGDKVVLTDENNNVISETEVPDNATANADEQNVVITLIANGETNKIVVKEGETITEEFLKSHIKLTEDYTVEGFYTDENYTISFDFSKAIDKDTTIYAKTAKVEDEEPTPVVPEPEKDETPKTGVENYLGIAVSVAILSTVAIIFTKKKEVKE